MKTVFATIAAVLALVMGSGGSDTPHRQSTHPDKRFGGLTYGYGGCLAPCYQDEGSIDAKGNVVVRHLNDDGSLKSADRIHLTARQLAAITDEVAKLAEREPEPAICCDIPTWNMRGTWDKQPWGYQSRVVPEVVKLVDKYVADWNENAPVLVLEDEG